MNSLHTHAHTVQSLFRQPEADKVGHYDMHMKGWMPKGGIMMCKLKGWMDKRGHYDVQMKRWMEKRHYDVQIKRVDG